MTTQMTWHEVPWLGFDTETTGIRPQTDRLVTAALVLRRGIRKHSGEDLVRTWLANPGVPIPEQASAVHGITTEQAQKYGRPAEEVLEEVAATVADHLSRGFPVVAFNASYDLSLMEAELQRHGLPTLQQRLGKPIGPIIDPLVLDRSLDRWRKGKRTLVLMAPVYGAEAQPDAHTAEVDVAMTLDVLAGINDKYSQTLGTMTATELHSWQQDAHTQWAEDFEAFLRKQGKDSTISRSWPLEEASSQ